MLLLLVLSVLTLFLVMGAVLLVLATRARTAARAFMAAASTVEASPILPRSLLEESLMLFVRGSRDPAVQERVSESLLGDTYGNGGNRSPFSAEPYDAFGDDAFLTEVDDGRVVKPAFGEAADMEVDNDADGVPDGVWLEGILPPTISPSGGQFTFRISYLVLDLDGRINVNTHGGGGSNRVGPADVNAANLPPFGANGWSLIRQGGQRTDAGAGRRPPPNLGRDIVPRGTTNTYANRLDRTAPRPASLTTPNPFTPGELERVLRPFDVDWSTLPPRLSAALADLENTARMLVTTDSWDVTTRTGDAARNQPQLRFDLNQGLGKEAFASQLYDAISDVAGATQQTAQWVANVAEFREPASEIKPLNIGQHTVEGVKPTVLGQAAGSWREGEFTSCGDLLAVPKGTKDEIERILAQNPREDPLHSLVVDRPAILEAVMVPSRFTATIQADPSREPGRINVNTCSDDIWKQVCGKDDLDRPSRPLRSLWDVLKGTAFSGGPLPHDIRDLDRDLANRIASIATVRSNVFAIWVTLEIADSGLLDASPTTHRLFAIVDRSIPVQYAEGMNSNVFQTFRVKRYLD